jgi:type VI secretion system protein ImpC
MENSTRNTMVTSVTLSTRTSEQPRMGPRPPEAPFKILLIGDFSGKSSAIDAAEPPTTSASSGTIGRPRRIDVDNWEEVLRQHAPKVRLPIGDPPVEITFSSIDDFHPDALFDRLPLFQQLRQWRRQLMQSSTFHDAARQVRMWAEQQSEGETEVDLGQRDAEVRNAGASEPHPGALGAEGQGTMETETSGAQGEAQLLDELLSRPVTEHARRPAMSLPDRKIAESWEAALRKMVLPYCVDDVSPDRDKLVATVDAAAEKLMRMLLHDPDFQQLESLWRGVEWFLKEEVEEDSPLQVHLVDLSWPDLKQHLAQAAAEEEGAAAEGTPVRRGAVRDLASLLFPEPSADPDTPRWQLVLGLFPLGASKEEFASLQQLGQWLSRAQVPLVSLADHSLFGYGPDDSPGGVEDWPPLPADVVQRWDELRQDPNMRWIGLIWPRFLLRLPYGRRTLPCESLGLEEYADDWRHEDYLWGNSALLWGAAVARQVTREDGVELGMEPVEFGGMPLHVYSEEGEPVAHPCTETMLGERDIAALISRGIMPTLSIRNADTIRLTSFRSLGDETLIQFTS